MLLAGCASGYQSTYRAATGMTPERIAALRATPPLAEPLVERTSGKADDAFFNAYNRRGYGVIGVASFTSSRGESDAAAIKQARAVGADLVVIAEPVHRGSSTTHIPLTLPTTTTAYTSGTATVYGSGGTATAVGNSTTTIHATQTSIIPVTVNHTGYGAAFFIKQRLVLGVNTRALNDEERAQLQTNKGLVIRAVVDGSPAYEADLLVGDIILSIDSHVVTTPESMNTLLDTKRGQSVNIKLSRQGKVVERDVTLGT